MQSTWNICISVLLIYKHTNMRFLFYISEVISCIYIIRQYFTFPNSSISILFFLLWYICYVCGHTLPWHLRSGQKQLETSLFPSFTMLLLGSTSGHLAWQHSHPLSHPSGLILVFCREYVITLLTENAHKGSTRVESPLQFSGCNSGSLIALDSEIGSELRAP